MVTRVLIMAGGTGGHVFPALAVAQELQSRGVDVVWMGTHRGLEAEIVPRAGIPIEWIKVGGLRGKGLHSWLLAPFKIAIALLQSLIILMRCRPMAVLGMGGFVAGPGGFVTWLLNKPLLIHEQNSVAGMTNRLLARLANTTMEAFPGALSARYKSIVTGNPVRNEISATDDPSQRFDNRYGQLRLLVLGGSQGAQALNEIVPKSIKLLPQHIRPEIRHQAGVRNVDAAEKYYLQAGITAEISPFIEDMAEAYAWADLVLCRAGALTISELTAVGVASILVPFPFAVDDHQTHNAAYLVNSGAALLLPQDQLSAQTFSQLLIDLCHTEKSSENLGCNRRKFIDMAQAARRLAKPDAAKQVASLCIEAAHA